MVGFVVKMIMKKESTGIFKIGCFVIYMVKFMVSTYF